MLITIIQRIITNLKDRGISLILACSLKNEFQKHLVPLNAATLILKKYHICIEIKQSQYEDISLLRFIIKKCR